MNLGSNDVSGMVNALGANQFAYEIETLSERYCGLADYLDMEFLPHNELIQYILFNVAGGRAIDSGLKTRVATLSACYLKVTANNRSWHPTKETFRSFCRRNGTPNVEWTRSATVCAESLWESCKNVVKV